MSHRLQSFLEFGPVSVEGDVGLVQDLQSSMGDAHVEASVSEDPILLPPPQP